ncbi:hypothetical protein [Taibaiella koreensis]|uniref:hypothetical protein n=1 Tax=Taibaiella koreensis TaxID=1268548 RepID=UPI000E59EE5F|nr:hypothetical protein [Taibaiella koreensis]
MKKLILAASLLVLGAQAKAALFINNNSSCTFNITMFAFDPTHAGCWALQSNVISVTSNNSTSYNSVASLNTMSPLWFGGAIASTAGGPTTWGWNAGKFFFSGGGGGGATVGLTSCGLPQTATIPNPCGGTVTVTWTPLSGSNNILIEAN